MTLGRLTPVQQFKIRQPRWHDKKVLLACFKVGTHNEVKFTDAKSLGKDPYYVSGEVAKSSPRTTNGTIDCYAVDLNKLEPLERN